MNARMVVKLHESGADPDRLERSSTNLRAELLQLDVASVKGVSSGPIPAGARAVDAAAVGAMLVTLRESWTVVATVVQGIQSWLGRHPGTSEAELIIGDKTLRLTAASSAQQDQLIDAFLKSIPEA